VLTRQPSGTRSTLIECAGPRVAARRLCGGIVRAHPGRGRA